MKQIILFILFCFTGVLSAQDSVSVKLPLFKYMQKKNILNHLDASVTVGTTGLGFDFAMPIGNSVQIRTGAAFVPHIKLKMTYGLEMTGDNTVTEGVTSFEKAAKVLKETTGREVRQQVSMWAMPKYNNFKLLVDVFPFKDKRWHFTAGFFLGNSNFATAYNRTEDMSNLLSVNLYNHIVDRLNETVSQLKEEGKWDDPNLKIVPADIFTWEDESIGIPKSIVESAVRHGYIGVPFGVLKNDVVKDGEVVYHKGDTYYVMPGKDNMIHTEGYVNKFKPYIGFGYGGHLFKGSDTMISFDAGVMFWGGSPKLVTHDGVDLVHDLPKIRGSVGRTVDLVKTFTVFPVINLRLTQRIF